VEYHADVAGVNPDDAIRQVHVWKQYPLVQMLFDALFLIVSYQLTIELRLLLNPLFDVQFSRGHLEAAAPSILTVLPLWLGAAIWMNIYRKPGASSIGAILLRAVESALLVCSLVIVCTFLFREMGAQLSRSFVVLFAPVVILALVGSRYAAILATFAVEHKWPMAERVAVVGAGLEALRTANRIRMSTGSGTMLAGVILPGSSVGTNEASQVSLLKNVTVLGNTSQLGELINKAKLQRLVLVGRDIAEEEALACQTISTRMGVTLSRVLEAEEVGARFRLSEICGLHLLELRPTQFTRRQEILKRSFDLVTAAATLLAISPLLALIAVLVKMSSKGPVIYRAPRVGKGGRHFTFLKFRTMHQGLENRQGLEHNNEKSGHVFKMKRDPRITTVGRYLRRFSLDELPQLANVLMGDMSLVGPRPLPAGDLDPDGQSRRFHAWAEQRSRVLPGITGLWQIRGRSDLTFDQMVEYDVEYIRNWSLNLDIRILLETPLKVFTGRGAY
jgi:exopolysaccharide biosynthesis polyprenyl glycosylphosphotransferase